MSHHSAPVVSLIDPAGVTTGTSQRPAGAAGQVSLARTGLAALDAVDRAFDALPSAGVLASATVALGVAVAGTVLGW